MTKTHIYKITILLILFSLNSCCFSAKEEYLGNNLYLSEFDNVDRRILYQSKSCATSGIEIVPMTVLEIAYNESWIIAKSGSKAQEIDFKFWVIKNNYLSQPDPETIKNNTQEFQSLESFSSHLIENKIELNLTRIDD